MSRRAEVIRLIWHFLEALGSLPTRVVADWYSSDFPTLLPKSPTYHPYGR